MFYVDFNQDYFTVFPCESSLKIVLEIDHYADNTF